MANKFHGGIKPQTDVSIPVLLRSTSNNQAITGTVAAAVTASYWRQGGASTSFSVFDLASVLDSHSDGGWIAASAGNQPGIYRLDLPDAAIASGADWVVFSVKVSGAYIFHHVYPLESQGTNDNYTLLTDTGYGLAQLVRSATPANRLSVTAGGFADSNVESWLDAVPSGLSSGRVQSEPQAFAAAADTELLSIVNQALDTPLSELTGDPGATPTIRTALALLFMAVRNKGRTTPATLQLHNDAGAVILQASLSDDGAQFVRTKLASP